MNRTVDVNRWSRTRGPDPNYGTEVHPDRIYPYNLYPTRSATNNVIVLVQTVWTRISSILFIIYASLGQVYYVDGGNVEMQAQRSEADK